MVNFTETTEKLESADLTQPAEPVTSRRCRTSRSNTAPPSTNILVQPDHGCSSATQSRVDEGGPRACVGMAIAMLRRMHELRSEWQELGAEKPFRVRIGINTGVLHRRQFRQPGPHGLHHHRQRRELRPRGCSPTPRSTASSWVTKPIRWLRTKSLRKSRPTIKVKGFAEPVRCYKVGGLYDHLAEAGTVIREEHAGSNSTSTCKSATRRRPSTSLKASPRLKA